MPSTSPYQRIDWSTLAHQAPALIALLLALAAIVWAVSRWSTVEQRASGVRGLMLLLVYTTVAAQALTTYAFDWAFKGDSPALGLEPMLNGQAMRPFVDRRLSTDVVRAISRAADRALRPQTIAWLQDGSPVRRFARPDETWDRQKALDFHAAYAFVFLCYLATLWLARAWSRRLWSDASLFADFAPPIALVLWLYARPSEFYDASEIMLLFASAICITERRLWLHLPVFLLAVYGKEADLLLAPIALIALRDEIPRSRWLTAGAAHVVGGAAIALAVRAAYAHNSGTSIQSHLADNVMFWTNWHAWVQVRDVFAPLIRTPSGGNVLLIATAVGLIAAGWPSSPPIVRRMLVTSLAICLPLLLLFVARDELRDLSIAFPSLYAVSCAGIGNLYASRSTVTG
jgi:hypothetical protein